jgi:hypothetical protein
MKYWGRIVIGAKGGLKKQADRPACFVSFELGSSTEGYPCISVFNIRSDE